MHINQPSLNSYLISDCNNLRLFEIVEEGRGEKGKIVVIRRVRLNESDIEKIRSIEEKWRQGKILLKTGHRKTGDVKYAGKDLTRNKIAQIQALKLKKQDKTDNAREIEIDITKEDLTEQLQEMSAQDLSLLEKIMNALKERLIKPSLLTRDLKPTTDVPLKADKKEKTELTGFREKTPTSARRNSKETAREIEQKQEEGNEKSRAQRRKKAKIAVELDKKSDDRRYKDNASYEKQKLHIGKQRKQIS